MKKFKNEQQHLEFLKYICARYRLFVMKYLRITKNQILELTSKQLHWNIEDCHIKNIQTLQQIDTLIQFYKGMCKSLIGKKNLPNRGNIKTLAQMYKERK